MSEQQPSNGTGTAKREVKPENLWLNLGFNLIIPIFLLMKGRKWFGGVLENVPGDPDAVLLVVALAFPVGYFAYDYFRRRKYNLLSILGLVSVLLTGGIGLLEIPTGWYAVKEAAIPLAIGVAVVVSLKTPWPLVRTLLFNREMLDVERVEQRLDERGNRAEFDRLLVLCTWLLAASFLISSVLNFLLARWIVVSPSGSEAFNNEVGKMLAWSWPVIVVPMMAIMMATLYLLARGIRRLAGLSFEEALAAHHREKMEDKAESGKRKSEN